MVSAKDKGKEPMEEDLQDPGKEKEIKSEDEEDQGQHSHTGTTIASIGVVTKPARVRRTTRMQTGGKAPRHSLAPRSLPPHTKNPFHTFIHNHAGKEDSKREGRKKNHKSWDPQTEMIMSRIDHNSELIHTLTFEIEDLGKLIKELIERIPPPPKE